MPDAISSSSRACANACYEPEPGPDEAVCRTPVERSASPPRLASSDPSPAVQQLVNRAWPSPSLPAGVNAGSTGVLLCRRIADVPLKEYTQLQHHFLMTELTAAGAGHCAGGVPGHGPIDLPLSPMCINDHSPEVGAPGVICEQVEADPTCVNQELELGKHIGLWAPPFNDCQTFAANVIANCSPPASTEGAEEESGAEGARGY